jgi:hypothetical protein
MRRLAQIGHLNTKGNGGGLALTQCPKRKGDRLQEPVSQERDKEQDGFARYFSKERDKEQDSLTHIFRNQSRKRTPQVALSKRSQVAPRICSVTESVFIAGR